MTLFERINFTIFLIGWLTIIGGSLWVILEVYDSIKYSVKKAVKKWQDKPYINR